MDGALTAMIGLAQNAKDPLESGLDVRAITRSVKKVAGTHIRFNPPELRCAVWLRPSRYEPHLQKEPQSFDFNRVYDNPLNQRHFITEFCRRGWVKTGDMVAKRPRPLLNRRSLLAIKCTSQTTCDPDFRSQIRSRACEVEPTYLDKPDVIVGLAFQFGPHKIITCWVPQT
jgi:hypothetical protein